MATAYRDGLVPLMNKQETTHYAVQAGLRAAIREDFESKIGRRIFYRQISKAYSCNSCNKIRCRR
jgi:hypothetical protein